MTLLLPNVLQSSASNAIWLKNANWTILSARNVSSCFLFAKETWNACVWDENVFNLFQLMQNSFNNQTKMSWRNHISNILSKKMQHLCSPHKWPMEIGHHKWPLKAIVVPNAKHEGYNWSFWRSRVVTKFHWSRVRTTQIPLCSLLSTKSQFAVKLYHFISRFFSTFHEFFDPWFT